MSRKEFQCIPSTVPEKIGFNAIRLAIRTYIHTPGGRQLLEQLQPAAREENVDEICSQTSEMLLLLQRDERVPVTTVEEISNWVEQARAEGAILSLEAFPAIRAHARLARVLYSFFQVHRETSPVIWTIAEKLELAAELEKAIDRAVTDQGALKDDASPGLKNIRNSLGSKRNTLRSVIQKIFRKASADGMASSEGPTIRGGRMVIPIQAEFKRKMDGFIHDISASGQTVFLEPVEALQINNDIRQLEAEERREIERILQSLTNQVRTNRPLLDRNSTLLGHLDLIHARTRLGASWDGVLPQRSNGRDWKILQGRNPNLVLKNRRLTQKEPVVPLDLELSDAEKGIIISGPNAGGKSVALKSMGIFAFMYQAGIPLPVQADSHMPVISGLYLDMGDEQSIENDLSTFSSRLKWMHDTLESLDSRGLVLIDEAGTGTDPEEGGALFQAFMETILERDATLIATTHHGALKVFAHDHPLLTNGAMEFNQENLAPAYRFRKGIPGSSYAFEIADRMNLPATLLERSRSLIGAQRDRMTELLLDLERRLQEAEETHLRYESLRQEAKKQQDLFTDKTRDLDEKRQQKLDEAWREADRIMKDANRKIEEAVEKISMEGRESRENIRQVRREVADHKRQIRKKTEKAPDTESSAPQPGAPSIGDHVSISGSDTTGELVEIQGDRAVVLAGGLKIKTTYRNLKKTLPSSGGGKAKRWQTSSYNQLISRDPVKLSLNLRGMRGDEAVKELMLYLDRAIAAGLREVEIIHGKGEGILKKLTHEYLEKRDEITRFELAPWERGGPGCTVVHLKE